MSDSGISYANDTTPPIGTGPQPTGATGSGETGGRVDEAKQAVRENASKFTAQAGDRARDYAEQGKAKAYDALGQLSRTIEDAAQQVEEKLGPQYGQYVRSAAGQVITLADRINATDVDELANDVRGFVRQSPGIAIGAAAAIGFVLTRLVQAGIDGRPD